MSGNADHNTSGQTLRESKWVVVRELSIFFLFIGIFVTLVIFAATSKTLTEDLKRFVEWVKVHQGLGSLAFFGAFVIGSCLPVPLFLLIVAAGYCFDNAGVSIFISYSGSVVGAGVAFGIGKLALRHVVRKYVIDRSRMFSALDRVIANNTKSFILLLRLPYTPYTKMNYILACTGIPFRDYITWTCVGIIPPVIAFSLLGSSLSSVPDMDSFPRSIIAITIAILLVVFGSVIILARRELLKETAAKGGNVRDDEGNEKNFDEEQESLLSPKMQ